MRRWHPRVSSLEKRSRYEGGHAFGRPSTSSVRTAEACSGCRSLEGGVDRDSHASTARPPRSWDPLGRANDSPHGRHDEQG